MFRAVRDLSLAGAEPRILSVVHPDMMGLGTDGGTNGDAGKTHSPSSLLEPIKAVFRKALNANR
jgi:hypothetical protein